MGKLFGRKMLSILILAALFTTFLSSLGFGAFAAEKEKEKQATLDQLGDGRYLYTYRVQNDIEFRGVNGESRWYFNVDDCFTVENFTFNVYYTISDMIRSDISYLTVYLNDIPIQSIKLRDDEEQLSKYVQFAIPADKVNQGYNSLKIITYSRISDCPCADDLNIANWIVVDGKTNYVITYNKENIDYEICDFPTPFIGKYADDAKGLGVVIPSDYTDSEIAAALTLVADLQAFQSDNNVAITLIKANDPKIAVFDSLIYVGRVKAMPKTLISDKRLESINANFAGILMGESNRNQPVFVIISDDGDALLNAVKALKNDDLKMQMEYDYMEISKYFDTAIKQDQTDSYITLKDMGITGIELEGAKKQVTNFSVNIPYNEVIADDASIHLKYRYSDNVDYDKSFVSIYLNGVPIGSQSLDREKKEGDELTLLIPDDLKDSSNFNFQIVFQLIPAGIITCQQYLYGDPWAYVEADSELFLPTADRPLLQFENLPNPFSRNNDINDTTIVLPDQPTGEDLDIACSFAEMIGTGVANNKGIVYAVNGNLLSNEDFDNNLIVFGTPDENSAIKTFNSNLWFQYDRKFSQLLSNEKLELLEPTSYTATVFELKESPKNEEKGLLTVTSKNRGYMEKAMQYFGSDKRGLLTGDAVLVTKDGEITAYRFQKEGDRPFVPTSILNSRNITKYLIFAGAVMAIIIFGIVMFYYKKKKKQ